MPVNIIYQSDAFVWVDVENAAPSDLEEIKNTYNINQYWLDDCVNPTHLPKIEENEDVKFILARQNTESERHNISGIGDISTKIGIFIKSNLLITIHRLPNEGVKMLCQKLKDNSINNPSSYKIALKLGTYILKTFDVQNVIMQEQLDHMENEIFLKKIYNSSQIERIYKFKRKSALNTKILNLSESWVDAFYKFPVEKIEARDLKDKYQDSLNSFEHLNVQAANLISLFLALTDQKNNAVMKMLAVYSVYFLPITFIAGLYGMNFKYMPELDQKYGYFACLGAMALVVICTFIYFKRKKF